MSLQITGQNEQLKSHITITLLTEKDLTSLIQMLELQELNYQPCYLEYSITR